MKIPHALPVLIISLAGLTFATSAAEPRKPNVLLIVADDLGYGELSAQGFTQQIPTPFVDSIAKNGVRFTSGYVSGPYCSPTRAALLTGRYQQRFGHEFNPGPAATAGEHVGLSLAEHTIADRLKPSGYATAWIGKSHLGYEPEFHPLKRGFDHYLGFLGGAHSYLDVEGRGEGRDPLQRDGKPLDKIDYTTDAFGREAVDFIDQHKSEPWFVYLAFNAVHEPLHSTDKYLSRFSNIDDPKRKEFAAGLSALDDNVGAVLNKLKELNLEEDTIVFFISDNGGPTAQTTSGNGPLHGFKAQTWEGGIRVPWIVQWKGHIPAGQVDSRPVIQLDILPTALAAANIPAQPDWKLEGVNLLPYVTGQNTAAPHDALYWRFGQQIAIRQGDWKLVKAPGGGAEPGKKGEATTEGAQLYNLAQDIGEKTNLASQQPDKVKELSTAWDAWNKSNIPPKWGAGGGGKKLAAAPVKATAPANPSATTTAPETPTAAAANAQGPWKSGDSLAGPAAPQVANHGLALTAQIEAGSPNGVIVAQGGAANGYALFIQDGKLAFALRSAKQLTVVTATKALDPGTRKVEAQLTAQGHVTLLVDGQSVGEGDAKGLIQRQPGEGLTVGNDGKNSVGEYTAPNAFSGKVENVSVKTL